MSSQHKTSKPDNEKYLDDLRYFIEIATSGSISGQDPITREIDRIVPLGPRTLPSEVVHFLMDAGVIIDTGGKGRHVPGEIRSYGLLSEKRNHRNGQLLYERANSLVFDINFATLWRVSSAVLRNLEYFLNREGSPLQRLVCRKDPIRPRLYYKNEFDEWSLNYDFIKDYIGDQQT